MLTYCPQKALNSNVPVTPAGMLSMMAALLKKHRDREIHTDTVIKNTNSILQTFPLCSSVNLGVSTQECVTKIR